MDIILSYLTIWFDKLHLIVYQFILRISNEDEYMASNPYKLLSLQFVSCIIMSCVFVGPPFLLVFYYLSNKKVKNLDKKDLKTEKNNPENTVSSIITKDQSDNEEKIEKRVKKVKKSAKNETKISKKDN